MPVGSDWSPSRTRLSASYEWRLDWLGGHLLWHSRTLCLSYRLYPNMTSNRSPEDTRGFELWECPLRPRQMQRQWDTLAADFQQIRDMGGWRHAGFAYWAGPSGSPVLRGDQGTDTSCDAIIPIWFPMVCFLILPGLWALRRGLALRRRPAGCCIACGYDLRASKGRCPECGTDRQLHKLVPSGNLDEAETSNAPYRKYLTIASLLACVLLCVTKFVHHVNVVGPPLWVEVRGDLIVSTGLFIKDLEWFDGRDPQWHTVLDNQAWFVTWHEPAEARRRWEVKLSGELLIPLTAMLPLSWGGTWILHFSRFVRRRARAEVRQLRLRPPAPRRRCPECGRPVPATT